MTEQRPQAPETSDGRTKTTEADQSRPADADRTDESFLGPAGDPVEGPDRIGTPPKST